MTLDAPSAPSSPGKPCCEKFARRISDHHDGRWPAGSGDCEKVEEHLATCPRCAELLDDYRLLSKAAEALRATDVSKDCAEVMRRRVRARIRAQVFRRRLGWTGAGVAVAAAASVAIAIAMLPDADPTAPSRKDAVAVKGQAEDKAPEEIDILRNPAVAALLKELREEALRVGDSADPLTEEQMSIQEEIDLRREWGVYRMPGIDFPVAGYDLDGFRLPLGPRGGPLARPGVMPVGGDGR
jgi:hypothetical protein